MVRVPRPSDTRVKKTAPFSPNLSKTAPIEAFGAGPSAREKSAAARGLAGDVSILILQERKKADDAQFNNKSAELAQLEIELGKERSKNLGENVLDYPEKESAARDKGQSRILDSITNRRVRKRLEAEAVSFSISGQKATQRHVDTEKKKYDKNSLTASVENNRIVALNSGDDSDIQNSILVNENKIRTYGASHGLSDDEIEISVFNATSKTHALNIERLMAIDTDLAKAYYDVHKKEIDQATLSKPKLDSRIAAFLKVNFDEIKDDLAEKQIAGELTPDDVLAVSEERSLGGIGAVEAQRWLKIIDNEQSAQISKILRAEKVEDEEDARVYIDLIDNLIDDRIGKFEMKQKLVEFGTRINKEERKILNDVSRILKDVEFQKQERNWLVPFGIRKSRDQIEDVLKKANFKDSEIKDALQNAIDFHVDANTSDGEKYLQETDKVNNDIINEAIMKKHPEVSKYVVGKTYHEDGVSFKVEEILTDGDIEVTEVSK